MSEAAAPATEAPVEEAPKAKGKGLLLWIALAVLLLGGGGAAYWFLVVKAKAAEVEAPAPKPPPLYVALDPPFVVNFEAEGLVRFLQITVQLMSRDAVTIDQLKAHDPVIRNDLLLLFGNQKYEQLSSREGKERLRAEALATVRRSLAAAGGDPKQVEAVYFTAFVMQ